LKVPLTTTLPLNDPGLQALVIDKIRSMMEAAKDPLIIVDGGMLTFLTSVLDH
jgi:pyruvate decarboxylase